MLSGSVTRHRRSAGATLTARAATLELLHDVRHPVAVILTLVDVLETQGEVPESARRYLSDIARQARAVADLCGTVSAAAPPAQRVRLDEVVAAVSAGAEAVHGCRVDLEASPVVIEATPGLAWRLVSNVVDNACSAATASGRVRVTVAAEGASAVLEVCDNGRGLEPPTASRVPLGLVIVDRTVRALGGEVTVGPLASGGTCVRAVLPALPSVSPAAAA